MSPRRYAGWEPRTTYHYSEDGRVEWTEPEPEWDEWDTALVDELLNWQAGLHTCGHHETDTADRGNLYVAGYTICRACEALQRAQEKQSETDKPARKAGRNPDYPRRWRVRRTTAEQVAREAAEQAQRKTPQQLMDEAVAQLEES